MEKSPRSREGEKKTKERKLSRTVPPKDLPPVEWQRRLRRQFGREQNFEIENVGTEPFFSEFRVANPLTKSAYRVEIRGASPGDNRCTCPDYATNELGTCKHIEFVLASLEGRPGAGRAFAAGYHPPFSELYLRNEHGLNVCFRAGTDCPESVLKEARRLFEMDGDGRLPSDRLGGLEGFLAFVRSVGHDLRAHDDALDFVAARRDARHREEKVDELFQGPEGRERLTSLLQVPLYPYQVEGALFAVRTGRVLIGDEMGLGKTVQAIAAAEILARHFGVTKVLVVCPTSLKYQWQSEIRKFADRDSRVISGGRPHREKEFLAEDFCKITNYEKLSPDLDLISAWGPDLVIVDEAQRVKNWNTIASRALKRIDSPYAVVLTGTPLENKLEELVSIVQFVDRYRLGPTWKLLHEHQVKDENGRVVGYTGLEKIGQTLAPVMLRRRKSEVLSQLPERTDQNLLVPMTEPQLRIHDENAEIVAAIALRWRRTGYLSEVDQRRLTCALQNMRMVCNSTFLIDQETDHGVKADELAALLDTLFSAPETKAVVFSQWTRTHDIVVRRLEARGIGYVRFHGGVPSDRRPALVDRFREDPACRVFLSTDAGATGLNLQHASVLVNMDLPWNPAILEQRIARIHRMGQKRPVQIVNFVAKGAIEEGMLQVLSFKQSLSEGILDGGAGEVSLGGSRLSRFMKEIESVTGQIGTAEAMTPAEEAGGGTEASGTLHGSGEEEEPAEEGIEEPEGEIPMGEPTSGGATDPWDALAGIGTLLASALSAARDPSAASDHPFVERDPKTGRSHLRLPLPSPETASKIGEALGLLAEALRGRSTR
ncbi:MAG: DEAD/DEAH box helicase [Nitrospirae bacterium]|nr:DEAD/DEAH box helicase [Nitrospirota bacterium]